LGSVGPGNANDVRDIFPSGALNYGYASSRYGGVAGLDII